MLSKQQIRMLIAVQTLGGILEGAINSNLPSFQLGKVVERKGLPAFQATRDHKQYEIGSEKEKSNQNGPCGKKKMNNH